jgi:hypothetical protein
MIVARVSLGPRGGGRGAVVGVSLGLLIVLHGYPHRLLVFLKFKNRKYYNVI